MSLNKLYITGTPGLDFVQHPSLAFVEIMLVLREGKMLVEVSGTPAGKEFKHVSAEGKVQLDTTIPIGGNPATDVNAEEFYVQFKS